MEEDRGMDPDLIEKATWAMGHLLGQLRPHDRKIPLRRLLKTFNINPDSLKEKESPTTEENQTP